MTIAVTITVAGVTAFSLSKVKTISAASIQSVYEIDPQIKTQIDEGIAIIEQFFIENGTTLSAEIAKEYDSIELMSAPNAFLYPTKYIPEFLEAWTAIKAYFVFQGYVLAYELLNHAWENTSKYSVYYPDSGSRVLQSSVFTNTIAYEPYCQEINSSAFPNSGTTADRDLFFAIAHFDYTKSYADNNMVQITLTDIYDFATQGYDDFVIGVAVNTMNLAEKMGFLTPFQTRITQTIAGAPFSVFNDGAYILDTSTGAVYVIAGGAPIYVSYWENVGGYKPYTNISHAVYETLPQYPRDDTYVIGYGHPEVYVFAGGAPIHVFHWNDVGGQYGKKIITVDFQVLNANHDTGYYRHVRLYPMDKTVLRTQHTYWIVAGGTPFMVHSWEDVLGPYPATKVSMNSVTVSYNHLRKTPLDNTNVITKTGAKYHFLNGKKIFDGYTVGATYVTSFLLFLSMNPSYTLVDMVALYDF